MKALLKSAGSEKKVIKGALKMPFTKWIDSRSDVIRDSALRSRFSY